MTEPQRPWRIVIIEDNPLDRAEVKSALRRGSLRRYELLEAESGAEGLELCGAGPRPDCVVLDFSLPDMTALDVLSALPVEAGQPAFPVVVLTGSVGSEVNTEVVRAGAQGFVGKDWMTPDSLTRVIENAVERHAMVAQLRLTTEALAQREHRLRLALEGAEIGMWTWNLATDEVDWSPECYAIHGLAAGEFDGTAEGFGRLLHPEDAGRVWSAVRAAIAARRTYDSEFRIVRPGGEVRWVTNKGRALYDEANEPAQMIGILTDVTDAKRIEAEREQLLAAEHAARVESERVARLKDEFLATLSHELRSPLNAIVGWAQILQKVGSGDARLVQEGIEVIARNADSQAQLISDLLDMNRIVSGKLKMEMGPVDPNLVAAEAADTVRPTASAKGVRLELAPGAALPRLHGDGERLRQVLWNLLTNAIKFTPAGGSVRLATEEGEGRLRFHVEDTGQGLDPEFVPRLFDRFSQADASAARKHGGLGLGLSIVKQLVELHGGTIRAESDGPGLGSRFTVSLPVPPEGAALEAEPPASRRKLAAPVPPAPPSYNLSGISVLLVDDQPDALEAARRLLTEYGAAVTVAPSGREALERLALSTPDVLLSDVGMPEMDGYRLIREVREGLGFGPGDLPAAALTAFARPEDRDRALAAGYQAHVAKPLHPQSLVSTVAALVHSLPDE